MPSFSFKETALLYCSDPVQSVDSFDPTVIPESEMCQTFNKWKDAIKRFGVHGGEEVIFAKEVEIVGKRIFLTCTKVNIQKLLF